MEAGVSCQSFPKDCCRVPYSSITIYRQSILLDRHHQPIPMSQVMPKYIPKEPVKACVSSPLARSQMSSRNGSMMFSEAESDSCSSHAGPSILSSNHSTHLVMDAGRIGSTARASKQHSRKNRHRLKKRSVVESKDKTRPVNVVGPIISHSDYGEDKDEVFNASGAESVESDAGDTRLQEEVVAQRKLISKLEEDLSNQLKVNAELKKLLVASVGNDLEYRVEKLAQDKAQLSATVGSYSQKLYKDFEDLDRISIQADMWRSKYLASRLQTEELTHSQESLTQKYTEATLALQQMLEERHSINTNLRTACSMMNDGKPQLNYQMSHMSTHHLSKYVLQMTKLLTKRDNLSDAVHLGDTSDIGGLSQSEQAAYEVLSEQQVPVLELEVPHSEEIPRYTSLLCTTVASRPKVFTV